MSSTRPKVLHEICGKPLIGHLLNSIDPLSSLSKVIAVIGYREELVREELKGWDLEFALQEEQKGTAHALQQARDRIESDHFLVFPGDLPLVKTSTIKRFIDFAEQGESGMSLLTVHRDNPDGYGRIKRNEDGTLMAIVEDQDASTEEKEIKEVNTGVYRLPAEEALWQELAALDSANAQGEFYLTDLVERFYSRGREITGKKAESTEEFLGVNTQQDLALAGRVLNGRKIDSLLVKGVTIVDPETTKIHGEVEVGRDTVIEPFTSLKGRTKIGAGARIGPNSEIIDGRIGDGAEVVHSVVKGAIVDDNSTVGPFQHINNSKDEDKR